MGANVTYTGETVDLTPSWVGMVNVIRLLLEAGDASGRAEGLALFKNMAMLADRYAALIKASRMTVEQFHATHPDRAEWFECEVVVPGHGPLVGTLAYEADPGDGDYRRIRIELPMLDDTLAPRVAATLSRDYHHHFPEAEPFEEMLTGTARECVVAFEEGMQGGTYPYEEGDHQKVAYDMGSSIAQRINSGQL